MTNAYTHDNDAKIAALYLAGGTGDEIGRQFGITGVTVYRALKRQGIARRQACPRSDWEDTEQNRRDLVAAYETGTGIARLARKFHVNGRRVVQILDESGHTGRHPGGKRRFTDEDASEFARLYQAGESLTQLGKQYGVSTQVVRRYLLRAGVELRPVGAPAFWTDERKAEVTRYYLAGHQIQDIAKVMGCGIDTLTRTLVELGVHEKKPYDRRGENSPSWQGGRVVRDDGYIQVRVTDENRHLADTNRSGYMLEHRLVMARKLGRPLLPGETPHHKNLIRSDNSPGNLELWVTSQPKGARVADLLEWSLDMLDRYMPESLAPGWQDMPLPEAIT